MTNNKQQTAVEWLINELHKKQENLTIMSYNHIFDKAKEMEKEQLQYKAFKEEQKQHIIDIMRGDEQLGLYKELITVQQIKQFLYGEICERRHYSATRMCEEVLDFITRIETGDNNKQNDMKNFETLEAGKTYRNRKGELVKIIKNDGDDIYPFDGDNDLCYTPKGFYWDDGQEYGDDLIELIEEKNQTNMKNFETLEVGKTYKNRNGKLVKIVKENKGDEFPFLGDDINTFTLGGSKYLNYEHEEDLIELIEDKQLTICEIDAKIAELQELRKELDKSVEVSNEWLGNEISVRYDGKYKNIGFWLRSTYNWGIVTDEFDCLVLIPTKKK
jgi:hypothetical protein